MIYIQLFLLFAKFSYCSFGGMSMMPLVIHDLTERGWMTLAEITDFIAIAEMTPGSFTINVATFCGIKLAGVPGAICASLGSMMPSLTITLIVAIVISLSGDAPILQRILYYVRPVAVAMLAYTVWDLASTNLIIDGSLNVICVLLAALCLLLKVKFKVSVPLILLISAVIALIAF